jgi:integrase
MLGPATSYSPSHHSMEYRQGRRDRNVPRHVLMCRKKREFAKKPDAGDAYGYAGQEPSYVAAWMIMQEAVQKAGFEGKGYSLHSLRHTFATNMINAGLRLEVLQQLLGHLTIDITLQYARISEVTREDAYLKAMEIIEKGGPP